MKKLLLILFMITSCVGVQPTPGDNIPQCCKGQESHTCGMPEMTDKPIEK